MLQDLSNKAQNSSQNNCTDSIQNGGQRSADLHRTEQNPLVEGRAGGDHMIGRIAHDMARGSSATTVNTVLPEDHQSRAEQQYREYNWENIDGQAPGTCYEDRSSSYYEDTSLNRNQVDQQRPYIVCTGKNRSTLLQKGILRICRAAEPKILETLIKSNSPRLMVRKTGKSG